MNIKEISTIIKVIPSNIVYAPAVDHLYVYD